MWKDFFRLLDILILLFLVAVIAFGLGVWSWIVISSKSPKIYEIKPIILAICSDTKAPTFRHIKYDAYKANRKKMPDELQEQIPVLYNIFKQSNIPLLVLDSYEADDIIGTFSKSVDNKENHTYIVSGDKDLMQLVNDSTSVYSLGNKFKPTTIYNEDK